MLIYIYNIRYVLIYLWHNADQLKTKKVEEIEFLNSNKECAANRYSTCSIHFFENVRVQIFKFPWLEARSLRNSQVFSSTSDVNSKQKIIVSSPTLFPVLLILPRWQQVTCSLIVSFLGIVGPKCCDSMKCHCFWEVMVFRYRPRGESQTSYVFSVVILYLNVKLYFKLQNTST